jgi:hypothetical protein
MMAVAAAMAGVWRRDRHDDADVNRKTRVRFLKWCPAADAQGIGATILRNSARTFSGLDQ